MHLVDTFAPLGGAELYMINQLSLLAGAGVDNTVVYWEEHPDTFAADAYPVHRVAASGPARLARIQALIEEKNPAVAYLHKVRDPAVIEAVSYMKPSVVYMHDFYPVCPGLAKFYRRGQSICTRPYGLGCAALIYLRRCASARNPLSVYRVMQTPARFLAAYQQAKKILVGSRYMKDLLIQNGLESGRISILPYFLHLPGVTTPPLAEEDGPRLLFVGRLEDVKGLPFLLKALAAVSQPYRLLVAGEGSQQDDYKALAQKLGIAEKVDFLGWVQPQQMAELYQQASFLVLPSIWPEPFGIAGIEAFCYSRPVIAFEGGGVSDWLKDGENGFLVPTQDAARLTEAIESLLANPDLAARMGRSGYDYVNKNHRAESHLEQLLGILTAVQE